MLVLLGAYDLDVPVEIGREPSEVKEFHIHPDWRSNGVTYDADIAIIVLSKTVKYSIHIRPICLPNSDIADDLDASIVGKLFYTVREKNCCKN